MSNPRDLAAALELYGEHLPDCAIITFDRRDRVNGIDFEEPDCTCGFDATLQRARGVRVAPDPQLGLRLARHLCVIQSEDGCDYVGQETNDLMFAVMTHFGLRTRLVTHEPVPSCEVVGPHNVTECGREDMPWEFEVDPNSGAPDLSGPSPAAVEVRLGELGSVNIRHGVAYSYCPECGTEQGPIESRVDGVAPKETP